MITTNNPAYIKEVLGLIERINLTIIDKARALLSHTKTPTYLQGEAVLVAVFLYNKNTTLSFK